MIFVNELFIFASLSASYKVCLHLQVSMVSRLKHDNVVELLGYCVDGNTRILAYEFATMGSLHDMLHGMTLYTCKIQCTDKFETYCQHELLS